MVEGAGFAIWSFLFQIFHPAAIRIVLGSPESNSLAALCKEPTGQPSTSWDFNSFMWNICLFMNSVINNSTKYIWPVNKVMYLFH